MCGIIGINSSKPVSATIINSLKKLEYRGMTQLVLPHFLMAQSMKLNLKEE